MNDKVKKNKNVNTELLLTGKKNNSQFTIHNLPLFTDTSEKGFQKYIVEELTNEEHNLGFIESFSRDFDKEFCINTSQLLTFIEQTQP